jgi:hypothetical protein
MYRILIFDPLLPSRIFSPNSSLDTTWNISNIEADIKCYILDNNFKRRLESAEFLEHTFSSGTVKDSTTSSC